MLEKIISSRININLNCNHLSNVFQSVYKQVHSSETVLLEVRNDISLNIDTRKVRALTLLDVSAAINIFEYYVLQDRLSDWCCISYQHSLGSHLYAADTQVYTSLSAANAYLSLIKLGDCLRDISGRMTNNRLNIDKTYFIIISTFKQHRKLSCFFYIPIFNYSIDQSHIVNVLVLY